MCKNHALTVEEQKARREYRKKLREKADPAKKEKLRAYKRAWSKAHPEKWREYQKRFYARLAAAAEAEQLAEGANIFEELETEDERS